MITKSCKIVAAILFAMGDMLISQSVDENFVTYLPLIDGSNGKVTCGSVIPVSKLCINLSLATQSSTNCSLECFTRHECRSFNIRGDAPSVICELFLGRSCRILLLRRAEKCSYYHDKNKPPKELWEQNVMHQPGDSTKTGWSEVLMQSQSTAGQSRANPFNRTWEMFKNGFSCLAGCYWLGNEVVYKLTKSEKCRLLIVLAPVMVDSRYYLYYDPFQIGSEEENFRFISLIFSAGISNFSTNILAGRAGANFSTFDRDVDFDPDQNCAVLYKCGWWFGPSNDPRCGVTNLNSVGHNFEYYDIGGVALDGTEMWLQCPPTVMKNGSVK